MCDTFQTTVSTHSLICYTILYMYSVYWCNTMYDTPPSSVVPIAESAIECVDYFQEFFFLKVYE